MTKEIVIFLNTLEFLDENQALIANCLRQRNYCVKFCLINSLRVVGEEVVGDCCEVKDHLSVYGRYGAELTAEVIDRIGLGWVMNQPHATIYDDIWRLLWLLERRMKLVNSVNSMVFLNNKISVNLLLPEENMIPTTVDYLDTRILESPELQTTDNVCKPTDGGCGADVFVLRQGDTNIRAIVQQATGHSRAFSCSSPDALLGLQQKYTVIQRFIPPEERREKRVIVSAGRTICAHGREMAVDDHRTNLSQGGKLVSTTLSAEEATLLSEVGSRLTENGINFAGIDLCYPYIIEFNIVNPGGLYDTMQLTGHDFTMATILALEQGRVIS